MMNRAVVLFACLFGLLFSAPGPASALEIAQSDSADLEGIVDGAALTLPVCPCFCNYECFGKTLVAPAEMQLRYIYLLYGVSVGFSLNTAVDFHILQGPSGSSPGTPFIDGQGNPSIGQYLPWSFGGPAQLMEIDVLLSEVNPPVVEAGEEFTIAFCYDHVDALDVITPNTGHGPVYDQDGTSTDNWIRSLVGNPDVDCGNDQATYSWINFPNGDFVIRASDAPVDWGSGAGDDDDTGTGDDDDTGAGDDDDTGTGDDDDAVTDGPVILNITPNAMVEGEPIAIQIIGENFDTSATAFIGGLAVSSLSLVSSARLDGTAPQALLSQDGGYDVTVSTTLGSNTLAGAFTVSPKTGPGGCRSSIAGGRTTLLALLALLLPATLLRRRRV